MDGTQKEVQLYQKHNQLYVFDREGNNFLISNTYDEVQKSKSELVDKEFVKSQMPGIVVRLLVKAGDSVKKGDVVAFLEAMKMEHKITVSEDAVIGEVFVKEKSFVEAGQPLFKLKQTAV